VTPADASRRAVHAVAARGVVAVDEQAIRRDAASVRHPLARVLLVLTFATGLIDAASYLGLGRVFTANMTGNIVLLGFAIGGADGLPVVAPIVSLGSFLLGAAVGGTIVERLADRHGALVGRALAAEAALLAAAAVLAAAAEVRPGEAAAYALIVLMALAMGVRNAVARHIGVPDLTTTVLTMTLTGLAADSGAARRPAQGSVRRLTAVTAMLTGAIVGALLLRVALFWPLAAAAALALITLAAYVPALPRRP
jgi:uncharacterized membrane protein YoaK (UPF0700 family)